MGWGARHLIGPPSHHSQNQSCPAAACEVWRVFPAADETANRATGTLSAVRGPTKTPGMRPPHVLRLAASAGWRRRHYQRGDGVLHGTTTTLYSSTRPVLCPLYSEWLPAASCQMPRRLLGGGEAQATVSAPYNNVVAKNLSSLASSLPIQRVRDTRTRNRAEGGKLCIIAVTNRLTIVCSALEPSTGRRRPLDKERRGRGGGGVPFSSRVGTASAAGRESCRAIVLCFPPQSSDTRTSC